MIRKVEGIFMNKDLIGIWYALAAYTAWGFLPLYWKLLDAIPSGEILAHRILWSFIFVLFILLFYKRWNELKEVLSQRKHRLVLMISSFLISCNWFTYIWAVNNGHVIEASLGYYMNPLISFLLGLLVLRERLNSWQYGSLALAFIGVLIITIEFGTVPWIAFSLALSFGFYGLCKKLVKLNSMVGLALETLFVVPIALIYISYLEVNGMGSLGHISMKELVLLMSAGITTALPLLWFAQGAQRIPLSTLGFIQYVSPSISLLLGIYVFEEPFTRVYMLSFGFIWSALFLYSISNSKWMVRIQPKKQVP